MASLPTQLFETLGVALAALGGGPSVQLYNTTSTTETRQAHPTSPTLSANHSRSLLASGMLSGHSRLPSQPTGQTVNSLPSLGSRSPSMMASTSARYTALNGVIETAANPTTMSNPSLTSASVRSPGADSLGALVPQHGLPDSHPAPMVTVGLPTAVTSVDVLPRTLSLAYQSHARNSTHLPNGAASIVSSTGSGNLNATSINSDGPTSTLNTEPTTPLNPTTRLALDAVASADATVGHTGRTLARRMLSRRTTIGPKRGDPLVLNMSLEMDDNRTVFMPGQRVEGLLKS